MSRKLALLLAILSVLLPACQPIQAPAPLPAVSDQIVLLSPTATVTQYSGVELPLTTVLTVTNPYDPAQIDLRVHFTAPDGQIRTVPAFWMQDFDPVTQRPTGEPGWRVRFTPHMPGEWFAQAELLSTPIDFVTDTTAKEFFKQRLRYIAARWAYSPNLFAWEWWNEVNWTGIGDQTLGPWIEEMTPALLAFDPYDHLITNSNANGTLTQLWALPELDFSQQHDYTGGDLNHTLAEDLRRITKIAPDKPVLMAELGYSAGAQDYLDAIHLHLGLWAAPFLGYAGGSMYWWWDNFVDPQNQWPQYNALAQFFDGEDLTATSVTTAPVTPGGATALALQSPDRAYLWLRSDSYSVPAVQGTYDKAVRDALKTKQKLTDWVYTPPLLSKLTVTLNGLADGEYTVQWYAPQTAEWLIQERIQVKNSVATLTIPTFDTDLAAKITRNN